MENKNNRDDKRCEVIDKVYRLLKYTYFHSLCVYNVVEG